MATKIMVPGASKSKGISSGIPVYDEGTYVVTWDKVELKETAAQNGDMLKLRGTIEDGPEQQDGENPVGQRFFHSIFIPRPEHPSFEKMEEMVAGRIHDLAVACEVPISKQDNLDIDKFEATTCEMDVVVELQENKRDGVTRPANEIKAYRSVV